VIILCAEGFAQTPDVDINGALFNIHVTAPHLIQQLGPSIDPFLVRHKELQQAIFGGADIQHAMGGGDAVANRVQGKAVDFNRGFNAGGRGTTQYRFQAGNQLPW